MVVGKQFIWIKIRQFVKFVNIFDISNMPGVDEVSSHAGVGAGIVLPVVKT